ncbi:uncharacterized protein TNIN_284071 [Trichonephila inaurata madagascariensis]|uniref:Protein kinase domain-containing protein n=1 Tax=Trichonephila inaurata madagascariensis TaxID=2747483 RepID=A0A8X7CAN2_9ARAC|nr:uncharacterized protein TNIN_284071 [Trichonephila inaurata madagascariensis]
MVEDILRRLQQVHGDMLITEQIYNETLIINENKVFTTVEMKLHDFGMISPQRIDRNDFDNKIARELGYNFIALQHQVTELIPQLTPEVMFSIKFYVK